MKLLLIIFILFTQAEEKDSFVCDPPKEIKDRVNEHCIQASQFSTEYPEAQKISFKKGIVLFTSTANEDGKIILKMAHQCKGEKISEWKTFDLFCGYEKVTLDRKTPAIQKIRKEVAQKNKLNEKRHSKQIDRLMAQQINAWFAEPKDNILIQDNVVKIRILKSTMGITCYEPQELTYLTNCK